MFSLEGIWEQPPNPRLQEQRRAGRRPSALPPAFPGGAGLGNTHPFIPQTLIQVCLPPGSLEHAAWGERRAQGQSQGEAQSSSAGANLNSLP